MQDKETFVKALVEEIIKQGERQVEVYDQKISNVYQVVKVKILDGEDRGKEVVIDHGGQFTISPAQLVREGQTVVLTAAALEEDGGKTFQIIDKYRLDGLFNIGLFFFILVILLSRLKGLGSFLGMIISLLVIVKFIVPQILAGRDPVLISITGSFVILFSGIYLAHGFSRQTSVAVVSTLITLILTGILSVIVVNMTRLTGLSSEEAYSLQFGPTATINFKGLLLGGMIIGFLGVLDDITTSLAATVFELKKVNEKLKLTELIRSSLN